MAAHLTDPEGAVWLEMGERSFGVIWASSGFCIRCVRGSVWITQEARRDDVVLERGDRCQAQGVQRVFLNSFKGALLAISETAPGPAGASRRRSKPLDLRLEITQGAYVLSGGRAEPRRIVRAGHRQRNHQPVVATATGTE